MVNAFLEKYQSKAYLELLIQAKCFPFGLNNINLNVDEPSDGNLETGSYGDWL